MRFRVSYQHDSMQCGAACLRMVCKHYGKEYALDFLSEQCGCMIDGVSLQAIRETAEDLGFRTFAVSVGLSELQAGWFEDAASVGICGATSTPKWLMQQVAEAIRNEELPPSAFGKTCMK